jgi:hypothetical protein
MYLVIVDDEVKVVVHSHEAAQNAACAWSKGRYSVAKVHWIPDQRPEAPLQTGNCNGKWYQGERHY